ncbi:SNF2 family N-terminal domain-containing protein [Immersiella caudata]|uniref:SNF2 family N-terminal domain-containing protein n=1 Tax=Immersiella caudata TaxID=314043 RepID=A0AA39XCK0_9PEZI|nr:SNF2 family N-terminal domain-containing protein [Immersiella caudata]
MDNAAGIPSKRPDPFPCDLTPLKRQALGDASALDPFSLREDSQLPWTAFNQATHKPWPPRITDLESHFEAVDAFNVTNFDADHCGPTFDAFANSNEIVGHDWDPGTTYWDEHIEGPAILQPFLSSEEFPPLMPNNQPTDEAFAAPEGSLIPQHVNNGTTLGPCLQPDGQTMAEYESYSGEMDVDVDMVCYGMLCGAKARLLDDSKKPQNPGLSLRSIKSGMIFMQTVSQKSCMLLQIVSGTDLAALDQGTARTLVGFEKLSSCQYDLFTRRKELLAAVNEHQTGKKNVEFSVHFVLYGPQQEQRAAGRILSKARSFLQHPSYMRPSVSKYDNPHMVCFTDQPSAPNPISNAAEDSVESEVEALFNNLDHQGELGTAGISDIVTTGLKSHQLFGVDFIAQREGRKPSSLPSIWHQERVNGSNCFTHAVTSDRRSWPDSETVGGILADEMGLGKTLTMLASIVGSLPESRQFSEQSPTGLNAKGTLVIAPSILVLEEWLSDIKDRSHRILKHHGNTKAKGVEDLLLCDIVLTTYSTLVSEFQNEESVLYDVNWFRVVLDEAHSVRHESTQQARAASNLSTRFRWCLTGTPIHNTLYDLGSLVSFLRISQLESKAAFRKHIVNPIREKQAGGIARLQLLLKSICLRRTTHCLELPELEEVVRRIQLSPAESLLYKAVQDHAKAEHSQLICTSENPNTEAVLLRAVTRLRRVCNHGTMDLKIQEEVRAEYLEDGDDKTDFVQLGDSQCCGKCGCDIKIISTDVGSETGRYTPCNDLLCSDCYAEWEQATAKRPGKAKPRCPICRKTVPKPGANSKKGHPQTEFDIQGHSSKISRLVQDIRQYNEKCIVFSSWTKTLDIVSSVFRREGIPYRRVDGTSNTAERINTLNTFQAEPNASALLMTIGTGAVGLNITAATRVYIIEPLWNPSIEKQAVGRAWRLGQKAKVTVVRYIVSGSIEEHIRKKQAHKLHLSKIGWDKDHANQARQDVEELKLCLQ